MNQPGPIAQQNNSYLVALIGSEYGWAHTINNALRSLNTVKRVIEIDSHSTDSEVIAAFIEADVILFCCPDHFINDYMLSLETVVGNKSKIIIDVATNKQSFTSQLKHLAKTHSVVSTHPMVASNSVIYKCPLLSMAVGENSTEASVFAESIFRETLQMEIIEFDYEQHSKVMGLLQLIPHLINRLSIYALNEALKLHNLKIGDLSKIATANFRFSELSLGRVGIQPSKVSAGIISNALETPDGKHLLGAIQQHLGLCIQKADNTSALIDIFDSSINSMDESGEWRKSIREKSDRLLVRIRNYECRTMRITTRNNHGSLRKALSIFEGLKINLSALDSDAVDGKASFDIGLDNPKNINLSALIEKLGKIGADVEFFSENGERA